MFKEISPFFVSFLKKILQPQKSFFKCPSVCKEKSTKIGRIHPESKQVIEVQRQSSFSINGNQKWKDEPPRFFNHSKNTFFLLFIREFHELV